MTHSLSEENMLEKLFIELGKQLDVVKTLSSNKPNWITKVDENGLYVETEASRLKYQNGEKENPWDIISFDFINEAWQEFIQKGTATANDFVKTRGRTSFLMAFFAELPFVEVVKKDQSLAIKLKKFKTDDLSSEPFNKVMAFLDGVIAEEYHPERLRKQIKNDNIYRIRSAERQDLRLLGLIDENHQKIQPNFHQYEMANSEERHLILRDIIKSKDYFKVVLYALQLLGDYPPSQKKELLVELAVLIVRSSTRDNEIRESVAKERTHNLLKWLESVDLIDENWNPIPEEELTPMNSNLREHFLHIMNSYLKAKTEPFGEHLLGAYMRRDLTSQIRDLPFITENYTVNGSVGMGNWAAVPWLAIMNNNITTTTQSGYYLVYLFSEDMKRVYLTLAQGITKTSREEMLKIKEEIRHSIEMKEKVNKDDDIYLGQSKKARDYAFSTAVYIEYDVETMPPEQELVQDLKDMVSYYEQYINLNNTQYEYNDTSIEVHDDLETVLTMKETVDHIYDYITSKGFYYEKEEVNNLYLSLKTKPFVIISGISGTGKTKIVQWVAESVGATEKNGQFTLIPVRPDWSDGSDLLGYVDISGKFKEGPLTKVIQNAIDHPTRPYFALLDEMNLARVEHYFSDILSVMESRKWEEGKLISSPLLSNEVTEREVYLPENLYIIGTVNMDETTHPFSKKVLDRANTIEFNRIKLNHFQFLLEKKEADPAVLHNDVFSAKYLHLKDVFHEHRSLVEKVTDELVKINDVLQLLTAHVGYRVRDEICFYLANNAEGDLMTFEQALDHCILQKILPRVSGSDTRVEKVLKELYKIFTNTELDDLDRVNLDDLAYVKYPKSAEKVLEMLRRLDDDGFTSFWIGS